jgi:copper resistance protein B
MSKPMMTRQGLSLLLCALLSNQYAQAQTTAPRTTNASSASQDEAARDMTGMDHSQMDHSKMSQAKPRQSKAAKPAAGKPTKDQSNMDHSGMDHSGMDHSQMTMPAPAQAAPAPMSQPPAMPAMDHSGMDHSQMTMPSAPQPASGAKPQQAIAHRAGDATGSMQMGSMQMGPMQGGKAPPDARDPNAYGEGARHSNLPGNEMMDDMPFGRVLIDNAELSRGDGEHGQNLDAEAWYGGDYNKLWLKAEGERTGGRLESLRTEALWDRAFAPFWSTQLGVRHDTGGGKSRNWLAAGVRGLAPYWFDVEATAYARSGGEFAARFDARYELLFTQRLILEPQLEGNLYSRADPDRGTGTGLSDIEFGLRLRYEIRRQFAPYIGVTWNRRFGSTADLARTRGEDATRFRAVAGLRIWY